MNKKIISTICGIIFIVAGATCSILYAVGDSSKPRWLIIIGAGIICAILAQVGSIQREEDQTKKHKKLISWICSSISMISVFIFLILLIIMKINNSWIAVFVGGVISAIVYMIDNARKEEKK